MPMPTGRRGIHCIGLAPSADAADRRETLIVGVKSAIGGTAEATTVKSAPRTIGVSRRPDRSRHDQGAEKAEREFHCFSFRIILSLATFNRQLSSSVAGCKFFTQRFYLAARPEAVGLQRTANHAAAWDRKLPSGGRGWSMTSND
jgi:hypothetical protein